MMDSKEDFTLENVKELLGHLNADAENRWGMMTPQHALEHLAAVVRTSTGKIRVDVVTPEEKIPRYKEKGLMDDGPWPENTISAVLPKGKLVPLQTESFEEAREQLIEEVTDFFRYYGQFPTAKETNAVFGPLTYEEWRQFHFKHFRHHLSQFSVLPVTPGQKKSNPA